MPAESEVLRQQLEDAAEAAAKLLAADPRGEEAEVQLEEAIQVGGCRRPQLRQAGSTDATSDGRLAPLCKERSWMHFTSPPACVLVDLPAASKPC